MRISSLDSYCPLDSNYAMMLESSEELYVFPPASNNVTFCFSAEQLVDVADLPLVLVDTCPRAAIPILLDLAHVDRRVEYWAPRMNTSNLQRIAADGGSKELAVAGCCLTKDWIQLQIVIASEQDRSCDDWIAGLAVGENPSGTSSEGSYAVAPEMTLRSLVISRITPLAKPLKKYLPGSLVILLYKILEKLR